MIDTHCHVDLYPDPSAVAKAAIAAGVSTIVVTNLPSAYRRAYPFITGVKQLRLALGLHPLVAQHHKAERASFKELVDQTFYIGEVGLDFSPQGYATRDIQLASFQFVLDTLQGKPKFITLHSRRAEAAVLELLQRAGRSPVVFHWYSGPLTVMQSALEQGHYFSINPAMTLSPNGQKVIKNLPIDRVLTESDGPFVSIDNRPAVPSDVACVEAYLAQHWQNNIKEVQRQVLENFRSLLLKVKTEL